MRIFHPPLRGDSRWFVPRSSLKLAFRCCPSSYYPYCKTCTKKAAPRNLACGLGHGAETVRLGGVDMGVVGIWGGFHANGPTRKFSLSATIASVIFTCDSERRYERAPKQNRRIVPCIWTDSRSQPGPDSEACQWHRPRPYGQS